MNNDIGIIKSKTIRITAVILAVILTVLSASPVSASSKKDKDRAISVLNNKMTEMEEIQEKEGKIYEELNELSKKVEAKENEIEEIQNRIDTKSEEIQESENELNKTLRDIKERKDGLNARLRTMYKNSSIGYIDIFLKSKSVEDMISNFDMVQRIYKHDQETLAQLSETYMFVGLVQEDLKKKKKELLTENAKLEEENRELQKIYDKVNEKYLVLKEEEERLEAEIEDIIDSNELEIDGETIKLISKYQGDYKWVCPVQGKYYVNKYGEYKAKRSYEAHPGIDMAAPSGTPIHAAEEGIVIKAGGYGGYGIAVVISHGSGLTTLYGHNRAVKVKVSQKVKKGEVIAEMGSTGWSTGPHCHFEVRKNGKLQDPRKYVKIHGPNY